MFRVGIQSSVFENECKISGFHGSAESHILFLDMLPTIQGITLLCLKAFTCLGGKDSTVFRDSGIHFTPYIVP